MYIIVYHCEKVGIKITIINEKKQLMINTYCVCLLMEISPER